MKDQASLILAASDGRRVELPLLPEALTRSRTGDVSGERLEFVTHLDDRLGEGRTSTASTLAALSALRDVSELQWGKRRFRGTLAELIVTETAFQEELEPIAATLRITFDVSSRTDQTSTE
jgi:hypothetical protein